MAYDKDIVLTVGLEPENVIDTAKQLNADIDKIFQKTSGHGDKLSTSFKSLQMQMDKARQQSINLQNTMQGLAGQIFPTDEFKTINSEITKTDSKLAALQLRKENLESRRHGTRTQAYQDVTDQLESLSQSYQELLQQREELINSGGAYIFGKDTEQYEQLTNTLNEVNNRMVILKQRAQETGEINLNGIIGAFQKLASSILKVGKAIASITLQTLISLFSRLGSVLGTVAVKAGTAAASLARMVGNTIISGVKKLAGAITSLHKAGSKNNNIFNGGFKAFIRYGLGVRSVFALVRKLRTALIEGFKDLAQVNEPFNKAMSEMLTALTYLRNAFVSAFAPIIETVSPLLSRFINQVADATNKMAMFIASLTGQEAIQAIPVYQDYAESAKTAAEKAKEAAKEAKRQKEEAKKLKRTIAGFDDVEILKEPKEDEPEEETKIAFTTSPILKAIDDFAKRLLDAWKNADFTGIGRLLGDKLLAALNKIPWNKIKEVLRKIAKSIATFLNGFLETPGLFSKIGETLAQILNSAFEFLYSFITNFHWDSLGKALRDGIIGFLDAIDWNLIYRTLQELGRGLGTTLENAFDNQEIWTKIFTSISRGLNSLIYGLDAFITSIDWGSIARYIAEGLNQGMEEFDWMALADLLSDIFNSIFDAWYNFVTTFDFFKFGNHIGEAISQSIRDIDWEKGGMGAGETINALFEALNGFILGIDWAELGNSIKESLLGTLTSINWTTIYETASNAGRGIGTAIQTSLNDPQIWTEVFSFLARGLNTAIYGLTEFIQSVNWGELGQNIATGLNNAINTIDWNALADLLSLGINAAFDFWYNFVTTFDFKEFGEHIGTALSKTVNDIDWEKGGYSVGATITGLLNALNGFAETTDWESIGKAAVDAISGFLDGLDWGTLGEFASNCLHALLSTLTGAIEEVDWASVPNKIGTAIGDFLVGFDWDTAASDAMELFGAACAAAVLLVGGLAGAIADWIKTGLTDMWNFFDSEIEDAGGDIGWGILNGLADIFKDIGNWLYENIILPITEGLASTLDIRSIVKNMFGVELPMIQDYSEALDGLAAASDSAGKTDAWDLLNDALQIMYDNGSLSDEALSNMSNTIDNLSGRLVPFGEAADIVNTALSNNNVSASDLNTALNSLPGYTDKVLSSFQDLTTESQDTSENTGAVATVLDSFEGVSLSTPTKLAVIRNALEKLGEKGDLSKGQVENLQKKLDGYNPYVPESRLSDLGGAFENAGISAESFTEVMISAVEDAQTDLGNDFDSILKDVKKLGDDLKTEGTTSGNNLGDGMVEGMGAKERDVATKATTLIDTDVLDAIDTAADSHSPSKEMKKRGNYLTQGLIQGMSELENSLSTLVTGALNTTLTNMQEFIERFKDKGAQIVQLLIAGIANGSDAGSISEAIQPVINQISLAFDWADWGGLGHNIGAGIYNGLSAEGGSLNILAHNMAIDMYNSAASALQIASPSKKFAYIGKMTMLGLGKGIEDNEGFAAEAISDVTDSIEDKASRANATINLSTNMGDVLTDFSDTIVNEFDKLISNLQALANFAITNVPSIAQGKVIPYASGYVNDKYDNTNEELLNELDYINAHQLNVDDLESMLETVLRKYLDIAFYIGDEQIARHANAGNLKLGRRYNM